MSTIFVLVILVVHSAAAVCLPMLSEKEMRYASDYPGRIWKWNRSSRDFDFMEALGNNGTAICNVDYIEDLSGETIIISGEPMPPYMIVNTDGSLTGYIGDIWTTLEQALKFRTVYQKPRSSAGWALVRSEVHAWLAATTMSTYPTGFYTYSHQIGTTYYSFFILSEGTRVSKWWYMSIFSRGLWAMSFSFIVGITGLLLVMYRFKRAVCLNYVECNDELAGPSFNFLNVLGLITGQGFQKFPTSWSLRVLIMSAVIMGMLISCGFSSTLTSYLAIRGNFLPFNSLEDIVHKRSHSLCVRSDSGVYDRLWTVLKSYSSVNSTEGGDLVNNKCPDMNSPRAINSNICKSGFVYLEALDIFLSIYRQVQHRCDIAQIPENFWSSNLVFLHARSAAHRRVIDKYLLRLRSAGILQYLERKWISRESPNSNNHQWGFKPVEYAHIDLVAIGLLIMILVSAIMCVLENIWFRIQQRIATKYRTRNLNNFPKAFYNFPANKLDSKTRRVWVINATN